MKKLLTIATIAATLSGLSAFGQGYIAWGGGVRSVWTANGAASAAGPAIYDVAFLWASGSATPLVDTALGLASVATNYAGTVSATAWSDILNDANFQIGVSFNGGTNVMATTGANGNFPYNNATTFPVTGLNANGGAMTEYIIAWLAVDGSTPQAAALVNGHVGWSAPFSYTYTSSIGTPLTLAQSGFLPFGVAPIPEPTTMVLIGLGGLALLAFRRRS